MLQNHSHRSGICVFLILITVVILLVILDQNPALAQQADTATPTTQPAGTSFITVTYIEPINVRTGPSSFDYPVIGTIPVGGTATAIGRSPAGEWIEIEFPDAPRGTAWVYAFNVTLSPGALLPLVEPPPTAAPLETDTPNPTFVAAFPILPTVTRLPTFTAPPPISIPTFETTFQSSQTRFVSAWIVIGLGILGLLGLAVSVIRRR